MNLPPTYAKDGFEAVDQWAMCNEADWNHATRECRYRGMSEEKRLQFLATEMLVGMVHYRALATRIRSMEPPAPIILNPELMTELETARACVKRLRATMRVEKEEHARTLAALTAFRQARDENPTSIFEKIFNPR